MFAALIKGMEEVLETTRVSITLSAFKKIQFIHKFTITSSSVGVCHLLSDLWLFFLHLNRHSHCFACQRVFTEQMVSYFRMVAVFVFVCVVCFIIKLFVFIVWSFC